MKKRIHVLGGGTFSYVRNHLALAAPAFGETARKLVEMIEWLDSKQNYFVFPAFTKMAHNRSNLVTNQDVEEYVDTLISDPSTRCIFFNVAMCDFDGEITAAIPSGKYAQRLRTSDGSQAMYLEPAKKVIGKIRKERKDIFVVGFKTTTNATPHDQFLAGLKLLKDNSLNLVLANDTVTRNNMIVVPEESSYGHTKDREAILQMLVNMTLSRLDLHYTRSRVVSEGQYHMGWNSNMVPETLRTVVNHCIKNGAYKPFQDKTAGHFATIFRNSGLIATSKRKTNFNRLDEVGLVQIAAEGPDEVIAYGAKPSVGGQSQRIVFEEHPEMDCIVHFHAPKKTYGEIIEKTQWQYECGSHECGKNTSDGLREVEPGIKAVYLHNHGPNIVFNHSIDPARVISFIDKHFDLKGNTHGLPEVRQ